MIDSWCDDKGNTETDEGGNAAAEDNSFDTKSGLAPLDHNSVRCNSALRKNSNSGPSAMVCTGGTANLSM